MEERYRNELDRICLTEASKQDLARALARPRAQEAAQPRRWTRLPLVAAALLCALVLAAGATLAVVVAGPVLRGYYGGAGYDQSAAVIGRAIVQDGWTMTLTDCVGDDRYLYLGMELAAPEGTVLGEESYAPMDYDLTVPGLWGAGMAWGLGQVPDDDPLDNRIHFVLWMESLRSGLNGQAVSLTIKGLRHGARWNEAEQKREFQQDCDAVWNFGTFPLSYPDNAIRLTPNLPVTSLGVGAEITSVEVSPIGVRVKIEGDALKGHHDWVPKDTPDGWYGCNERQEVTLYGKDGKALEPDPDLAPFGVRAGSGCSGGDLAHPEPGWIFVSQSYGYLLDLNELDHIEINGVNIPLQ